jgi:hypothetical protein
MQAFHLFEGVTYAGLARMFRRAPRHVPRWLWEPEYIAFRAYVAATTGRESQ